MRLPDPLALFLLVPFLTLPGGCFSNFDPRDGGGDDAAGDADGDTDGDTDGDADGDPGDGDVADADGGGIVELVAAPAAIEDLWAHPRALLTYEVEISRIGGGSLPALDAFASAEWIGTTGPSVVDSATASVTVTIDARSLPLGESTGSVSVFGADGGAVPVVVPVHIRVMPLLHVGPGPTSCVREDAFLGELAACDFSGPSALQNAAAYFDGTGGRLLLYPDGDSRAVYEGPIELHGETWLSAAEGVLPENVAVLSTAGPGVLVLVGDDVHVQGITIMNGCGSNTALTTWLVPDDPSVATSGHLVENVMGLAFCPEILGANSLEAPFEIGPDTTIRNSAFLGFYESSIDLTNASRSRILNTTLIHYQETGAPWDVSGAADVVIANNAVAALTTPVEAFVLATSDTTGLTLAENYLEGFAAAGIGLDTVALPGSIGGNVLGELELDSPFEPLRLLGSTHRAGRVVAGEGVSLDGVVLTGESAVFPGAFQLESARGLPRRTTIRVGEGSCGGSTCDVTPSEDDEIQRALWSVWPGGVVEVYPRATPYAGNGLIGWSVTLRGAGGPPEEIVLTSGEEDALFVDFDTWRHASLITVLQRQADPVTIEGLSLVPDAAAAAGAHAVFVESAAGATPSSPHQIRRVIVGGTGDASGLDEALVIGDHVVVQDALIQGTYEVCVRFGPRRSGNYATPPTTSHVVNVTCRLSSATGESPRAAFDVASVDGALFANIAFETDVAVPLFRAQRRSSGDGGSTALDVPTSFTLRAMSYRGTSNRYGGFSASDGTYDVVGLDQVGGSEAFFISDTDSRLESGSPAMDSGVDPADFDGSLSPGTSLNGIDRSGVSAIDRGAYEQGS